MPRHTIAGKMLEATADLVDGDRNRTHGDKLQNFRNIAAIWSAYLTNAGGKSVTAVQVCDLMELMKVARRQSGSHNPDDNIDGAGYAAVGLEVYERGVEEMQELAEADLKAAGISRSDLEKPSSGPS